MNGMTSAERVQAALSHREPDRVPLLLPLTMYGAKELGLTIREYFSRAENVVEGQMRMLVKYGHDILAPAFYAALEIEAWGGEALFIDDGPPNAGAPLFRSPGDIARVSTPSISGNKCLQKGLQAIAELKARVGGETPIVGTVISPFSLPIMQMGFGPYLDLMHEEPEAFWRLMALNESFCVAWANAQLAAGATAICYADPMSSPTMVPREFYLKTGFPIARRMVAAIHGPVAVHFASTRCLGIADLLPQTGTVAVGVSAEEDLAEVKRTLAGKAAIIGNLNGLEMRRWDVRQAEEATRLALAAGGPGGGFILSDSHGEIPWQVPEEVLLTISRTVREWGRYPMG